MSERDPKRDLPRIRDVEQWPVRPFLPVVRSTPDGEPLTGFIREDDVVADEEIRVFGSSRESWQALVAELPLDGLDLPVVERYDSLERLLADGWAVD